jgi:hypothetical protein
VLYSGKKRIERMAVQLNIKSHLAMEAFNYFRLAVNRHMTQGRNSEHFAAACLYIACRINASSEMGNALSYQLYLVVVMCFLFMQVTYCNYLCHSNYYIRIIYRQYNGCTISA